MLPIERAIRHSGGLYLNKNIYDHRELLIWPAYTPVTPKLLHLAEKWGIRLSSEDLEAGEDTFLRAADTAFEELAAVFRDAGNTGRVRISELRRYVVPMLTSTLATSTLPQLLVHLRKKDDETLRHSVGVGALSVMLGRWLKLSQTELDHLALAALLHDIGKLRIDRRVLLKPGRLSPAEFEEMKKHTVHGYEILMSNEEIPETCALVALRHHERWNGSGYPNGLSYEAVDPYSRIIAVTDVFHAMTSKRSYKEELPFYRVIREMYASVFGQFDPGYALVFLTNMMESLIGTQAVLTNGKRARIVALNANDLLRPLVEVNGKFLDLSKHQHIHIQGYE